MFVSSYDEHDEEIEALTKKILTPELAARLKKKLADELIPIWEYAVDEVLEGAAESVSNVASDRAKKFLLAVLDGKEDASLNLFGLSGFTGRDIERPVIHGTLFEAEPIKLRRQLCEANADLLRNARIADLESLLDAACKQVASLQEEIDRRWRNRDIG